MPQEKKVEKVEKSEQKISCEAVQAYITNELKSNIFDTARDELDSAFFVIRKKTFFDRVLFLPPERLKQVIDKFPMLLTLQDEDGNTIIHTAATHYAAGSRNKADSMLSFLFGYSSVNFNIMNNEGNTPLHEAMKLRKNSKYGLPIIKQFFAAAAKNKKTDFGMRDKGGYSVLHAAVLQDNVIGYGPYGQPSTIDFYSHGYDSLFDLVHQNAPDIDWNGLSRSGATPLFYALHWAKFSMAKTLLDECKADPVLKGSNDRDPVKEIERHKGDVESIKNIDGGVIKAIVLALHKKITQKAATSAEVKSGIEALSFLTPSSGQTPSRSPAEQTSTDTNTAQATTVKPART